MEVRKVMAERRLAIRRIGGSDSGGRWLMGSLSGICPVG